MPGYKIVRPDTAFTAAKAARQRQPRRKADAHLRWIRSLPCVVCGKRGSNHAAHLRAAAPQYGKRAIGISEKPDDSWTLPLCPEHHLWGDDAQHEAAELEFWRRLDVNPFVLSLILWRASGDDAAAELTLTISSKSGALAAALTP